MEKEMNEEKPLAIPVNCPPVDYVINGFAWTEIAYVAAVGSVGLIIGAYIFLRKDNPMLAAFIVFLSIFAAIIFFGRDIYTENMLDKLRILLRYKRAPKKYEYIYCNIYENLKNPNIMQEDKK